MCNRPIKKDGDTFACRTCDACIAARRANWVGRALAEKTQWKHALIVTLTYDDRAPGGYDAARMFAYGDVRNFIQRITAALRYIDKTLCVRFICAGEQGSRTDRCHWHIILYSDYDLRTLGTVEGYKGRITDPSEMMTVGKNVKRLHWSLWAEQKIPKGFVTFGEADEAGMAYVISYCLKDQFAAEKSNGTGREAKGENFATGLFRMSKRPAIGLRWVVEKLERLDASGDVLPNTQIKIPGLSGFWYPSGSLREEIMWALKAIALRREWRGLGLPPQWASLIEACKDNPKDMEILLGQEKEQRPESYIERRDLRAYPKRKPPALARPTSVCASAIPCTDCLNYLSKAVLASLGVERRENPSGAWYYIAAEGQIAIHKRRETFAPDGIAPYCQGNRD